MKNGKKTVKLSVDDKKKIVKHFQEGLLSPKQISEIFHVSLSATYRIKQLHSLHGDAYFQKLETSKSIPPNRSKINYVHSQCISDLIQKDPMISLINICRQLKMQYDLDITTQTVRKHFVEGGLRKNGFPHIYFQRHEPHHIQIDQYDKLKHLAPQCHFTTTFYSSFPAYLSSHPSKSMLSLDSKTLPDDLCKVDESIHQKRSDYITEYMSLQQEEVLFVFCSVAGWFCSCINEKDISTLISHEKQPEAERVPSTSSDLIIPIGKRRSCEETSKSTIPKKKSIAPLSIPFMTHMNVTVALSVDGDGSMRRSLVEDISFNITSFFLSVIQSYPPFGATGVLSEGCHTSSMSQDISSTSFIPQASPRRSQKVCFVFPSCMSRFVPRCEVEIRRRGHCLLFIPPLSQSISPCECLFASWLRTCVTFFPKLKKTYIGVDPVKLWISHMKRIWDECSKDTIRGIISLMERNQFLKVLKDAARYPPK
ncbi:hypothetical protein ADUPG1_010095 [Aduncisulcus paluster]|uniref:Transposase n=1 Tax=Aduncisulcus paluster TaxID=2918883 RepID=A0ABQ5KZ08_9EUKA|nr:hypothetical protein ADUPG1_010095 [Aduncisulcus paluster]